ncbi:MAG TPA: radical SAM protein, partial [Candidatus Omnitrophota bacterium]|nr:radical SAM protein [Candidatus Omnitrophota bacterium]
MSNPTEKIDPKLRHSAKLHRLRDVLPLSTPFSILVDPSNACNFKCTFCPTGDNELLQSVNRPLGLMSLALFCKIVEDMKGFDRKLIKLFMYKDGEPFLNKELANMIAYAKKAGVAESIEITSNGALINEAWAGKILDAGLDGLRVSVEHVHDAGYKKITQTNTTYEAVRKNIEYL